MLALSFVRFCFRLLATWLLLLPFNLLPVFASQWLFRCSVPLSLPCFPPFSLPDCSSFLPGLSYLASCSFPFVLPRFAPTAVPRVLALCFRFRPFPFPIRYMTFADRSGSDYSALCSSFPLFPVSPLSGFPGARFRFRFLRFPRSFLLGCPHILSRFRYSAFCLFPFALP